jgi:hypothetical protein
MKKLSLTDVSQIAEIVGAVAIIASLVFVGLEVRQNTSAIQSSAAQSVHENFAAWYLALPSEPALLAISTKGMRDYDSLTDTEKAQFLALFMAFCSNTQDAFYKWREGSLAPELWKSWEFVSMNFFSTQGGAAFWEERGYMFADAFQLYVMEDLMKRKPHPKAKPFGAFRIDK